MATIDTIVTPILKFETEAPPPEQPDPGLRGFVDIADDERAIILEPDHPSNQLYRHMLSLLAADQIVAFLDVERDTRILRAVTLAATGGVSAVDQESTGEVVVQLVGSSRIYVLRPTEPGFGAMHQTLKDAFHEPARVSIKTKPASTDIEEVHRTGPFQGPTRTTGLKFGNALVETLTKVSENVGKKLFAFLAQKTCPLPINSSCLPFRYPDDGCQGRAHLMCRDLLTASSGGSGLPNVVSGKIWRHHTVDRQAYEVATSNSPECKVNWLFHCAPLIRLTDNTLRVLDPALFNEPVPPEAWEARQTKKGMRTISDKAVFYIRRPPGDPVPPAFPLFLDGDHANAKDTVGAARVAFISRVGLHGTPPYPCPHVNP
jgi:Glutaminase